MIADFDDDSQTFVQDVAEAQAEVQESFEALTRTLDSYSALKALHANASDFPAESFESISRPVLMAIYAGTGIELMDSDYSTESVGEMLKRAADSIIKAITEFFKKLLDLMSKVDLASTWMLRNVTMLERKRIASKGKVPDTDTVSIGRIHRYLRTGKIFADDSLKLSRELDHLLTTLQIIARDYTSALSEAVTRIPSNTSKKTGSDLSAALVQSVLEIPFDSLASKLKMSSVGYDRFNRNGVLGTQPLIGGDTIYYFKSDLLSKGVKGFRFHGFILETTAKELIKVSETREFKTLEPADLTGLPELLRNILQTISKGSSEGTRSKIKRIKHDLEGYVKVQSGNYELTESDMDAIRKTAAAITYWSHSVTNPLFSTSLSVVRAVLNYCNASIKTYR